MNVSNKTDQSKKSNRSMIFAFRNAWIRSEALRLIEKPPSRKRKRGKKSEKSDQTTK